MSKSIENFLPKKIENRPVQGNVDTKLFAVVDSYRKNRGLTWNELITALFERLVEETKRKPKAG